MEQVLDRSGWPALLRPAGDDHGPHGKDEHADSEKGPEEDGYDRAGWDAFTLERCLPQAWSTDHSVRAGTSGTRVEFKGCRFERVDGAREAAKDTNVCVGSIVGRVSSRAELDGRGRGAVDLRQLDLIFVARRKGRGSIPSHHRVIGVALVHVKCEAHGFPASDARQLVVHPRAGTHLTMNGDLGLKREIDHLNEHRKANRGGSTAHD
mmetsp:Transcript_45983/g.152422  ORF Transcript_45983/g.152422 Transcript_45983/m.152422 type:complete len:208 (-) Transcript_45983:1330-1953(-)